MKLAVTFYNNVFNKTRHKEIIRDRRSEKRKRAMRGGNAKKKEIRSALVVVR